MLRKEGCILSVWLPSDVAGSPALSLLVTLTELVLVISFLASMVNCFDEMVSSDFCERKNRAMVLMRE